MTTYPNQKIMHIQKKEYKRDFLQVGIDEWQEAFKTLKTSTFALYLYLASNADGYDLALSQKAVENDIGLSKATYHRAVDELEESGYIRHIKGNIYSFHTSLTDETVSQMRQDSLTDETRKSHGRDKVVSQVSTEINTIYNINTIDSQCEAKGSNKERKQEVSLSLINNKKRNLEELSEKELEAIKKDLAVNNTPYVEIAKQYNLSRFIYKDFLVLYEALATKKQNEAMRTKYETQRVFSDTELLWETKRKNIKTRRALEELEEDAI